MGKILCEFDGLRAECKVIENMGFQGGRYTKAVIYEDKERTVQNYDGIWKPRKISEKL